MRKAAGPRLRWRICALATTDRASTARLTSVRLYIEAPSLVFDQIEGPTIEARAKKTGGEIAIVDVPINL